LIGPDNILIVDYCGQGKPYRFRLQNPKALFLVEV